MKANERNRIEEKGMDERMSQIKPWATKGFRKGARSKQQGGKSQRSWGRSKGCGAKGKGREHGAWGVVHGAWELIENINFAEELGGRAESPLVSSWPSCSTDLGRDSLSQSPNLRSNPKSNLKSVG